jgi:hypothetical protein
VVEAGVVGTGWGWCGGQGSSCWLRRVANTLNAARVGVTRQRVLRWRTRYGEAGMAGLEEVDRPGRPPQIDETIAIYAVPELALPALPVAVCLR